MDWNVLYSILKETREGKGNIPLNEEYANRINSRISIKDIEKMELSEVKEAVISYLEVIGVS